MSVGVPVLLVTMLGARSREMSLKGSTVVDTVLQERGQRINVSSVDKQTQIDEKVDMLCEAAHTHE